VARRLADGAGERGFGAGERERGGYLERECKAESARRAESGAGIGAVVLIQRRERKRERCS
jgi:hypothetical protein